MSDDVLHGTRAPGPRAARLRDPAVRSRLRSAGDDCWRAGELVVFFFAGALVFGGPPVAPPIFTPGLAPAAGSLGASHRSAAVPDGDRPTVVVVRPLADEPDAARPAGSVALDADASR